MKKKFLCLLLGIVLCLSFVLPLYAIDGTIIADDNATLITPLEITNVPTGAAAVAHNLTTNQTYYYRINGNILPSNNNENLSEPGWMPENHSVNAVIGNDNRERVSNYQAAPFSAIAYIKTTYPNGETYDGTATMISSNAALTAAHCLYNSERGGWATEITVSPAVNGSTRGTLNYPYGSAMATEIAISIPRFENSRPEASWDWGVIRLNSNIGNDSGFLGFQCIEPSLEATPIMISGYPGPLNRYWETRDQFYHVFRITSDISSQKIASNGTVYDCRLLTYKLDTEKGQSGSAILYDNNGTYQIIGVHSAAQPIDDGDDDPNNDIYVYNKGFGITS